MAKAQKDPSDSRDRCTLIASHQSQFPDSDGNNAFPVLNSRDPQIYHRPVLVNEVLAALNLHSNGQYVDCTAGEGGHTSAIINNISPKGSILALDVDSTLVKRTRARLYEHPNVTVIHSNYAQLLTVAENIGLENVNGILFDLGFSSFHIEASGRGFSFRSNEPLDMRFNSSQTLTAAKIVNTYTIDDLADVLERYGEEKRSYRIAKAIIQSRPINTSGLLASVIEKTIGRRSRIHPATLTFQALRIAVNSELDSLKKGLHGAISLLKHGGRLVVISYHSLEDRITKQMFRKEESLNNVNKKVIKASREEIIQNPRSRSARLRIGERVRLQAKEVNNV